MTTAAPTSVRKPSTAPSATRSARSATSSTRAGRVNAQPPTSAAGTADASEQEGALDTASFREGQPEEHDDHGGRDADAGEGEEQRERGDEDEQPSGYPHQHPVTGRGAEPEPERESDVREQRKRVPVLHGLAQPGDPVSLGIERGHGLGQEGPREDDPGDDREETCSQACRGSTAERGEDGTEPEKRREGHALVERVPAAVRGDRPPGRGADPGHEQQHRGDEGSAGSSEPRRGDQPESDREEHRGEQHDGRAANRKHSLDAGPVSGERGPERASPRRARRERRRRLRAPGPTAPAPHPWRARLPAPALFPRFRRGVSDRPSNNSFTLHSRRPHQEPEDSSYFSGFRPRP